MLDCCEMLTIQITKWVRINSYNYLENKAMPHACNINISRYSA